MAYDSVDAFMAVLPELAQPMKEKLQAHNGLFELKLPQTQYYIRLEDGLVTVTAECDNYPNCIIQMDEQQALDMVNGRVSPLKALLFGKVRIQGDVKPLLRLCALV